MKKTALAVPALTAWWQLRRENQSDLTAAVGRAVAWIIGATARGHVIEPSPIGLYFAKLWYFQKLYPLIFTFEGPGRA